MSKPSKPCVFCGATGQKSREHIYPRWMKSVVPSQLATSEHFTIEYDQPNKEAFIRQGKLWRPGRPIDQGLKIVCAACNNGWMSRLQKLAKPALEPLLSGKDTVASIIPVWRTVARWCAMSTVVYENADPRTASSNPAERNWIREFEGAPPNWRVWVANLNKSAREPSHARSALSLFPHSNPPSANTHVDFFVAGHFAFVTASSPPQDTFFMPIVAETMRDFMELKDPPAGERQASIASEQSILDLFWDLKERLHIFNTEV